MRCYRRLLKIPWTKNKSNKEIIQMADVGERLLQQLMKLKLRYAGHIKRGSSGPLLQLSLEGKIEEKRGQGRTRRNWMDDVKEWSGSTSYGDAKRKAANREEWRDMIRLAHLVPPLILFLAKHPIVSNYDLSFFKKILVGAAPLGQDLITEVLKRHPNLESIIQGYGLTETSPGLCISTSQTLGSVGPPLPNTLLTIVDPESQKVLGVGEHGEICVKGPQVMLGYYKNQEATDNMITSDGWMYTGDIGYFDEDGMVYVEDRLKELIKYKGTQVAPAELEALLLTHPDIQDAAVVGVPDQAAGELPRAFVVVKPGSDLTEEQVASFVEGKVASWKKLRGGVQFLKEIPKSPSGKILRRVIRADYL
ncbi:4-coumarate--CoA ligase [Elysia marginata]|uniref:4-coumarate--CoA ligase n=1 Tax=Elysia marginata TaxID=1093978 RepID=A0AAV4JLW1_9GAST|nr:4-coumarate--CoA ligase [Elysia marginata]